MSSWRTVTSFSFVLVAAVVCGCSETTFDPAEALAKAKIELVDAVKSAKAAVPGGFPLEVEMAVVDGKAYFDVEVMNTEGIWSLRVDAVTGDVVSTTVVEPSEKETRVLDAIKQVDEAKRTALPKALTQVLAKVAGGRPIEVDVDFNERSKPAFEIRLLVNDAKWLEVVEIEEG